MIIISYLKASKKCEVRLSQKKNAMNGFCRFIAWLYHPFISVT